jgi:hypothetical protein
VIIIPFYVAEYFPPEHGGERHPPHQHAESDNTTTQAQIEAQYFITPPRVPRVPFSQRDRPVPRGAVPDITLRTWVAPLNLNLLG